jgi:Bacterial protein of unknown function (DUF885)
MRESPREGRARGRPARARRAARRLPRRPQGSATPTIPDAQKLFIEQAFQDVGTAKQQSMRGTLDPMYLNYTLGKLMILKLRADWRAKAGAAFDLRAFHDRVLSYGDAPLPIIRRAMLGSDSGPPL